MKYLLYFLLFFAWLVEAIAGVEVINYTFDDQSYGVLSHGNYWTIQPSGGPDGSPAARLEYSVSGTSGKNLGLSVASYASNEFTVEFDVKIEGTPYGGSKFVKFFGDSQASKNNMTLPIDYSQQLQGMVGFYGDSACAAWYKVDGYAYCGTVVQSRAGMIGMRGGQWGHYKAWVKRSSPGNLDGELKVWWNSELRAHFSGMDSNPTTYADPTPGFYLIELGGYNHASSDGGLDGYFADGITPTWYLWVDNLVINSGATETSVSCDASHLYLCTTQTPCLAAGGYWWSDGACHSSQEVVTPPSSSVSLRGIGGAAREINGHLLGVGQ